jgi:hypothetical protein
MNHNNPLKINNEFINSNEKTTNRRSTNVDVVATSTSSFSIINNNKPNSLESYSSSISSNSDHLSASESISSKSANLIFIPNQKEKKIDKSESSSTSSVFAGLSVLSFSESNSIPSLSSSISYSDATEIEHQHQHQQTNDRLINNRPLIDLKKQFNSSSFSFSCLEDKHEIFNANSYSEITSVYKNKLFYGKDWFYTKLNEVMLNKKTDDYYLNSSMSTSSGLSSFLSVSSTALMQTSCCLVILGESGTGKTHLCCELKWPTNIENTDLQSINKQILGVYFLNWFSSKQNCIKQIYLYLSKLIQDLVEDETFAFKDTLELDDFLNNQIDLDQNENYYSELYVTNLANEFIENVLTPISGKKLKNVYILIDGIDEIILQSERLLLLFDSKKRENNLTSAEMLLMFINKIFKSFPNWLNLILTCKNLNEKLYFKKYLFNLKYEKIIMDKSVNVDSILTTTTTESNLTSESINENRTDSIQSSSNSFHSISSLNSKQTDSFELCNAAHFTNLKDIQTYILKRLDNDLILKKKFNKSNAIDLFNLLLIKSNFCVLYVEKVLDLVMNDFICSNDIKDIPATLNGLYLYLIESILNKVSFVKGQLLDKKQILYSILSICLIEPGQFEKLNVFNRICSRYKDLNFDYFENIFNLIIPILFVKNHLISQSDSKYLLYHSSLVDWLTDVKFCTNNYLVNLNEAHFTLSFYYLKQVKLTKEITNLNWNKFKLHLLNSYSVMPETCLNYFYLLCQSDCEINMILDDLDEKFLECKNLLISEEDNKLIDYNKIFDVSFLPNKNCDLVAEEINIQIILFDLITKGDLKSIKKKIKLQPNIKNRLVTMTDAFNQTALLVAVKLNNFELVEYLTNIPAINLDHCDNSGWTSLRYSSWMG